MEQKWNKNGTRMAPDRQETGEQKWNKNGTNMAQEWNKNGTNMDWDIV